MRKTATAAIWITRPSHSNSMLNILGEVDQ